MPKKSFLELLTGASRTEENKPSSTSSGREYVEKESKTLRAEEEKKDWLSESEEGQLTLDVFQDGDYIVIKSTIAGVKPEDLDVTVNNDMVTIKGERKQDEEVLESNYYYQELYWGPFSRSVILPAEVDADQAQAEMDNGILTIRLPKRKSEQKKRIEVTKKG